MDTNNEEEFDDYVNDRLDEREHKLLLFVPPTDPNKKDKPNFKNTLMDRYTEKDFKKKFLFRKETVISVLLPLVNEHLERFSRRGHPVAPINQLLAALRFYATGSVKIVTIEMRPVLSQPTTSRIVKKLSHLFSLQEKQFIKFPADLEQTKEEFKKIAYVSNIIGAIDTTHIAIQNPGGIFTEAYTNNRNRFSVVAQIVCGPDLTIYDVTTHPGSATKQSMYESTIRKRFEKGELNGVVIGDNNYTADEYLINPGKNPGCTVLAAHKTVFNTIDLWTSMFACFDEKLATNLATTSHVIITSAILYNIYEKYEKNISSNKTTN